jgi:hypothetical protein
VRATEQLPRRRVSALEHGLEPGHRCFALQPGRWRRRRTSGPGTHRGQTDTPRGRWPAHGCNTPSAPPTTWRCRPPPRPLPSRLRWRERRTRGALLSSDDFASSVERTATLHPLWQCRVDGRAMQCGTGGALHDRVSGSGVGVELGQVVTVLL